MRYSFDTSKGQVDFDYERGTAWSRLNPRYDVEVSVDGSWKDFEDTDCGEVEDMFGWLIDQDVQFECPSSLLFNLKTMEDLLDDSSRTQGERLAIIEGLGEEGCRRRLDEDYCFGLDPETGYVCKPWVVTLKSQNPAASISDQEFFWYVALGQTEEVLDDIRRNAFLDAFVLYMRWCDRLDERRPIEDMVVLDGRGITQSCYDGTKDADGHRVFYDHIPDYTSKYYTPERG